MRHLKSVLLSALLTATPVLAATNVNSGPSACRQLLCCVQLQGTVFVCPPPHPIQL